MTTIAHYIEAMRGASNSLKAADVPFLVYGLPLIAILGGGALLYLSFQGIVRKRTRAMLRWGSNTQYYTVEGRMAVVLGFFYLITFLGILVILLPFSLCLLGLL